MATKIKWPLKLKQVLKSIYPKIVIDNNVVPTVLNG
jgi:hypothetical protein